jgi:large conductance mechanosensitive channel
MENNSQNLKRTLARDLFEFLREYSVIGLAIGVIVAQISKDVVDAIVKGLFTPLIKLIMPGESFQNMAFYIKGVKFDIGSIISALLTFFIVLIILYILIKKILKKEDLLRKQ